MSEERFSRAPRSSDRRPADRGPGPYVAVALLVWALPAALGLIGWLTAPDVNASGQCEGIGFGCTLTPKDSIQFLAMFGGPVLVVVGLVLMGLIALSRWWRDRPR